MRSFGAKHSFAITLGVLLSTAELLALTNAPGFKPVLPDTKVWAQGRFVYQNNCLVCHGTFGDGQGEMGKEIKPPPRDFRRGVFKYRSTPAGTLPTNADLEQTIRTGLPGTAMPVFSNLSAAEVKSVIEYVKGFSSRWRYPTNYAAALVIPKTPDWLENETESKSHETSGRALFQTGCAACHGDDGAGHGPAAKGMEDTWGLASVPADLRLPAIRSGPGLDAIYRVLVTGIDGTPMPSFADALTTEQRWDLVAFIALFRKEYELHNSK